MKLILTSALLFILLPVTFGQKTYIPDSGFEEALIFEGLDSALDDSITTSIIDTLTFLDLGPFNITDLTGIEDFIALKTLICRNNDIVQLDLSNLVFLEVLDCENNDLSSLVVDNCGNLKHLAAENNSLLSINLVQNPLLEILVLNENGITTLNTDFNTALKTLRLRSNLVTSLDLQFNTQLEDIEISSNQLSSLDVTNSPNLKTLVVYTNSIVQLDLSNNSNLELLLAMNNELTSLDLSNNSLLTGIDCYDNNLESMTLPPIDILLSGTLGTVNNPNLFCIQCDNPAYVNANWNVVIDTFTVVSDLCSAGINELKTEVKIFPNPTENGWISVKTDLNGTYQLFGLNGAQLQNGEITQSTNLLDFSNFKAGMYFLHLKLNDQFITRRVEIF